MRIPSESMDATTILLKDFPLFRWDCLLVVYMEREGEGRIKRERARNDGGKSDYSSSIEFLLMTGTGKPCIESCNSKVPPIHSLERSLFRLNIYLSRPRVGSVDEIFIFNVVHLMTDEQFLNTHRLQLLYLGILTKSRHFHFFIKFQIFRQTLSSGSG